MSNEQNSYFCIMPSDLRELIIKLLDELNMEARALGRSDYPKDYPLKEIYVLANHCAGGIILGFEQTYLKTGITKRGTGHEAIIKSPVSIPTPWNHIEAGILYGLKLPLLISKEPEIKGGVFDYGITDVYVHNMPKSTIDKNGYRELKQNFLSLQS